MESEDPLDINTDYQVLASAMRVNGAIGLFAEEIETKDVGYVHNNMGAHQLFEQMVGYHRATKATKVDPVGFEAWLTTESPLYNAIGGQEGYRSLIAKLANVDPPESTALVSLVKFRARKQRNLDRIKKLENDYTVADASQVNELYKLADEVKNSFTDVDNDPLRKVRTATDILAGAEDLWNMDAFLSTPFKNLNRAMGYGDDGGFFRGGVHSIVALSGMGKPLWVESMITMHDGSTKRLGSIKIGDMVLTHKGNIKIVTAVHDQGELPTVNIVTRYGRNITSALDHTFLTDSGWKQVDEFDETTQLKVFENHYKTIRDDSQEPPMLDVPITGTVEVGLKQCRCLTIADDESFVANGFIVHNSTLTKNLCNGWLDQGLSVLFVNFEEPQAHWERILMTQMTGVNVYEGFYKMTSAQMSKVTEEFKQRISKWGSRLMVSHNPDTLYFEDLEQWLREVKGSSPIKPDVVVIDTIQSMFTKTGGGARWGDFEQIMVRSEKLAKEMDAAFIYTAQQNLSSLKDRRDVLTQADMGGSATITQKSTVAMFITPLRGSDDEHDTASDRLMNIQIVKSRITGTSQSESPPILSYNDATKSYTEYDPHKEDERYTAAEVKVNPNEDL